MSNSQSMLCPSCRKLISDYLDECPHCGLKSPASKKTLYQLLGSGRRNFPKIIISVNIAFFAVSFLLPLLLPFNIPVFQRSFAFLPSPSSYSLELLGWADITMVRQGHWWVLFTAMFLHGGVLHILFNMLWVRDLAPQTEVLFSPHKMIIIYILSGVGGNLAALYFPVLARTLLSIPMNNYPVIGASGAVFGLMGAIIAFGRKRGGFWGRQIVRQIGKWAAILIAMGFLFPGVSNTGHIGGFVSGFIVGQIMPLNNSSVKEKFYLILSMGLILTCGYAFLQAAARIIAISASA